MLQKLLEQPIWIDWIALILTVLGFGFSIYEIKKTKSSVDASKEAAAKTLQALINKHTISEIASLSSGLREVQIALRGKRYEAASLRIQAIRNGLHQLRGRNGFSSTKKQTEIQEIIASLSKLQDGLEKKIENPEFSLSVPSANNKISEYISQFSEWGDQFQFSPEEEKVP